MRGRILLARRTEGRDLAGAWEFPGGKVDLGETPLQALARELNEELGIRIGPATPLIAVPQRYPSKRIVLDVFELAGYQGKPRGLEQQALMWSPIDKLHTYPMPPADRPVVAALQQTALYAITPDSVDESELLDSVRRAVHAGIVRVQLRAPRLDQTQFRAVAAQAADITRAGGVDLLLNSTPEIAEELGTGLHVNAARLMALRQRPIAADRCFGASCHDAAELRHAQEIGADYAFLSPVLPTSTHPQAKTLGWSGFAALREQVSLPIYALGGLAPAMLREARAHGAQGIAGIRAFS